MGYKLAKTSDDQQAEQRLLLMYEKFLGEGKTLSPKDREKYEELKREYAGRVMPRMGGFTPGKAASSLYTSIASSPMPTSEMMKLVNEYATKLNKRPEDIKSAYEIAQQQFHEIQKAKYGTSVQISPQVQIDQKELQKQSQLYNQVKKQAEVEARSLEFTTEHGPGKESKKGLGSYVRKLFNISKDITLI